MRNVHSDGVWGWFNTKSLPGALGSRHWVCPAFCLGDGLLDVASFSNLLDNLLVILKRLHLYLSMLGPCTE